MPMDHRARHLHEKAKAAAAELGLQVLDPDAAGDITAAEWRALVQLPAMKRVIGWLAEGLVASRDAAELAELQRKTMRGTRPGAGKVNELAKDQTLQQWAAEIYAKALRVIASEANKS